MSPPLGRVFLHACALPIEYLRRLRRGYFPGRSPEIVMVPKRPHYFGTAFGDTTHAGPWNYLQRVPLVFYGPGHIKDRKTVSSARPVTMADVAPTIASLLNVSFEADGTPIAGALKKETTIPPRVVVVVVWDGGGWNVLHQWPDAWPTLRRLMHRGASVRNVTVGSTPSVTPAIHATLGTGTFPRRHGIVDIPLREDGEVVDSWRFVSPRHLESPTFADSYDLSTNNRAKVAMIAEEPWHLGMIGHGAGSPGGDHDIAVLGDYAGRLYSNPRFYGFPSYVRSLDYKQYFDEVDLSDGIRDGSWRERYLLSNTENLKFTPVFTLYANRILKRLISKEEFGRDGITDLVFINLKQIDLVGHAWNMTAPEVEEAVQWSDRALQDLMSFLNLRVGRRRWVLVITADHGQTPLRQRAWPIEIDELVDDVENRFDPETRGLIQERRPTGLWLHHRATEAAGTSARKIARFMLDYRVADNVMAGVTTSEDFHGRPSERLFQAVFPYRWMASVWECARGRQS